MHSWDNRWPRLVSILLALVFGLGAGLAWAQPRHALVIGNGAYKDAPLTNAVNDARAIAGVLRSGGFQVSLKENLDHRGMQAALREFGDRLRGGGVGLFYFAGHGMQIKGRNYLVPVGSTIEREDEVAYAALDAQAVLDKMEAAGNGANVMVLDACRNNPFARSFRSSTQGLAQMDAPAGTLVAFATSPGSVASDGTGQNGLYTQHLLESMRQPGLKIEEVFKRTRAAVRRDSQGKQVPWESTSLEGDFYFTAPVAAAAPSGATAASAAQASLEQAMWDMVRQSRQPVELRAYLARFPQGQYAAQARAQLAALTTPAPAAPAATPAPAPAPSVAMATPAAAASRPGASRPPAPAVAATPAAAPPPEPVSEADVERRTQELLAELEKRQPATGAAKPVNPPARATNPLGFAVGDRWRYQVVDKYRGEVVSNYTLRVDRILPDGDMAWNGKQITTTPEGNFRRDEHSGWPTRRYVDADVLVPSAFRAGHTQDVKFTIQATRGSDGAQIVETATGKLVVKGLERVKVPAGEFEAWRVERDLTVNGGTQDGKSQWFGRATFVGWYVPSLRHFIVKELERRVGSGVAERVRHEMTSYEVSSVNTAQR